MGRLAVAAAVAAWAVPVAALVNSVVPDPYMDEIFHVPQAQRYCRGEFLVWDPMITTPPGLYYISLAYLASLFPGAWAIKVAEAFDPLCTTALLRSTNVMMAMVCGVLVYDLLLCIKPGIGKTKATAYAILVALYPVHWFFTFLYYTDVASLAAVLAMYLFCLKKRFWVSAMFGAISILFRQTNIIWMLFFAANGAITYVQDLPVSDYVSHKNSRLTDKSSTEVLDRDNTASAPGLRRRRTNSSISQSRVVSGSTNLHISAKEAHVVSPHFAQFLYFGLVSAAALLPLHFTPRRVSELFRWCAKNKTSSSLAMLVALGLSFVAVHFFSIAHPYLLADNRHYTFYIWRKVIQAHWMMKYILIPIYVYSWFSVINILGKSQTRVWVLSFVFAVALVLVPAPLVEFRYYTIPLVIVVLNSPVIGNCRLLALGSAYTAADLCTLVMFLFKPFHWEHETGTQRFIW
ncbi:dol-P-Glc:Glc(2)Man(9)GlcNAc(2)-PP-Dol alpha-1,2-glucosyltransferase isoform X2 [Lolium perenne]|uniref:dol-P-Glc:Glc(2)Man(9)GlcNAc(2)-PP-Dol alpha-1,2-glucosyltransferase isoform X2 n=1 Tax=Lolium perenne TaxID=4522 RepID=UPI0021F58199|nr:dol-P-Glc:Glc(2)Man(9)GlcNAc(2)-PP-Dol alpha-1,2-glucosyltransferase isoform X2 [Lolium perenne]